MCIRTAIKVILYTEDYIFNEEHKKLYIYLSNIISMWFAHMIRMINMENPIKNKSFDVWTGHTYTLLTFLG